MLLLLYFSLPYFRYLTTLDISSDPLTMQPDTTSEVPSRQYNWVAYENCIECNATKLFRAQVNVSCTGNTFTCLDGNCSAHCGFFDVSLGENVTENLQIMLVFEATSGLLWYTDGVFVLFT